MHQKSALTLKIDIFINFEIRSSFNGKFKSWLNYKKINFGILNLTFSLSFSEVQGGFICDFWSEAFCASEQLWGRKSAQIYELSTLIISVPFHLDFCFNDDFMNFWKRNSLLSWKNKYFKNYCWYIETSKINFFLLQLLAFK